MLALVREKMKKKERKKNSEKYCKLSELLDFYQMFQTLTGLIIALK